MEDQLIADKQKELEALYASVAHRILRGENKDMILADLIDRGWDEESARELMDNVEDTIEEYEEPSKEWKRNKVRKYKNLTALGSALLATGAIMQFFVGFSLLSIGLLIAGFINFVSGLSMWMRYKK